MTDKEKLEKLKKLADAMYYAAQHLTTDASRLHEAMDEYHQFIINEYHKEEPSIDDLEKASKEWLKSQLDKSYANYGEAKMMELTHFDGYSMLDAIEFGAKWQFEQMMAKAVDVSIAIPYPNGNGDYTRLVDSKEALPFGDNIKVLVIKEE